MTTLQERAAQLDKYLITNNTPGERQGIIVKADDAPEWVGDVVYSVHGESFPDDWTYKAIKEAASAIAEDGENAQLEPDIYTRDLLNWLGDYPAATDNCDQATLDYDTAADAGIIERIQVGQAWTLANIVTCVLSELERLPKEEGDYEEYDAIMQEEHFAAVLAEENA